MRVRAKQLKKKYIKKSGEEMDKIKEAFKSTARAKSIQVITDSFIKVEATATRAARPDS